MAALQARTSRIRRSASAPHRWVPRFSVELEIHPAGGTSVMSTAVIRKIMEKAEHRIPQALSDAIDANEVTKAEASEALEDIAASQKQPGESLAQSFSK